MMKRAKGYLNIGEIDMVLLKETGELPEVLLRRVVVAAVRPNRLQSSSETK